MGTVWLSNGISMTGNHSETGHTVIRPWFVGYSNGPAIWMSAIRIQLYTMDINKRLDWYPDHGLMSDRKMDHLLNYRQKSPFFKPWSEYLTSILVFRCFRYLNPHCSRRCLGATLLYLFQSHTLFSHWPTWRSSNRPTWISSALFATS